MLRNQSSGRIKQITDAIIHSPQKISEFRIKDRDDGILVHMFLDDLQCMVIIPVDYTRNNFTRDFINPAIQALYPEDEE